MTGVPWLAFFQILDSAQLVLGRSPCAALRPHPKQPLMVIILILIGCLCQLDNVSTKMVVKIAYLSDEDQVNFVMNTRSDILREIMATSGHTSAQQHDVSTAIGGHRSLVERGIHSKLHCIYEE